MADKLSSLLDFVTFTHQIREVERYTWVKGIEQPENDSEHSFQLALIALNIIETRQLKLDPFRCMGLAVVHDIVEVYAGDTPALFDTKLRASQAEREAAGIVALKQQWPNMKLLHQLIDEYEARQTPESTFIYALDKLVPILNNYLDEGRNWHREHITLEQVMAAKAGKVTLDPIVNDYYEAIIATLRNHTELFG